jgi:hypothetical protein
VPKVKIQVIVLACLATAFLGAQAALKVDGHTTFITLGVLGTFVIGWIDNIVFPGITMIYEAEDIGLATGILGSIRAVGGAVAQSLYVSILTTKVATYLPEYVVPAAVGAGLPASSIPALFAGITAGNFSAVPDITPEIIAATGAAVTHAYVSSFHIVFYAVIPFGCLLIFFGALTPNFEKYLTHDVARRLQGVGKLDAKARDVEGEAV